MKKILSIIMAATMVLSMTACGSSTAKGKDESLAT